MKRIAVFISGSGSDMQSVIDGCESGYIDGKVVCVVSSKPGAYGLERAKKHGIDSAVFALRDYDGDCEKRDAAILGYISGYDVDLIVLAGYLGIVTSQLVSEYIGRMINIHPSLIPAFCGKGYYGLKVHEAALERGVKVVGATVHFVDEGTDTGPIILQKAVETEQGDTPEVLQRRVMEQAEWIILPRAIDLIANGKVRVEGRRTVIEE